MAYTPVGWLNDQAPAINKTNLKHMEDGIIDSEKYTANLYDANAVKIPLSSKADGVKNNVTISWLSDNVVQLSGSSGSTIGYSNLVLTTNGTFPDGTKVSDLKRIVVRVDKTGTIPGYFVEYLVKDTDNSNWHGTTFITEDITIIEIPANVTDYLFRIRINTNESYAGKAYISIQTKLDNFETVMEKMIPVVNQKRLDNNTDLNSVITNGIYYLHENYTYTNTPANWTGAKMLIVTNSEGVINQMLIRIPNVRPIIYKRFRSNNLWRDWANIDDDFSKYEQVNDSLYVTTGLLDFNEVTTNSIYLIDDRYQYSNKPSGFTVGFLLAAKTGNFCLQLAWQFNGGKMWKRRGNKAETTWEEWVLISGDGGTVINNNYTFNEYSNSYSVTATPSITSDTNNYLASSGDTTDRTNDIITMLTQNGVCRLGPGDFYVNGVDMPESSFLVGSGRKTRLILSGSGDGYCVKMGNYCQISDLAMYGSLNSITLSSTVGGRHGLLWQGNYTQTQSSASQPVMGIVNNVRFFNFTGGGITCYDTGYGTYNALEVCNAYMWGCNAGINISYWSEFHKFTNVRTPSCYYGCINNGGNNTFVNCDFSTCKLGFLMDNSQSQSPNNSHGSVVGCVFNHTDSNNGIGIKILNCNNGYIFTGCQIFFSQIDIEDSSGIVISDTNFGLTNTNITIVNGGAVLFANNIHQGAPTISITNNQFVHFANCYTRAGEAVSA